uniref:Sushi, von Willebrand factor type A, EGF and pentraxin domain-containing protein 1-like isoform X2 n=1 Tax=Crassostrea virginica TaxID=6565 RepID=A0A8B8DKY8_CRAVI|nr:sushi, von Willebrand factor type A, EGF and pentraxin domain-containing protein 1-like isoform X2 [Crassostrea virginica]
MAGRSSISATTLRGLLFLILVCSIEPLRLGKDNGKKKCRVSDLDENEDVDRVVYDGDPYILEETVYECQDGRWIKRGTAALRRFKRRSWVRKGMCLIGINRRRCKETDRPPSFTSCPNSGVVIYAAELETYANHTWSEPTAHDPEDGNLRVVLTSEQTNGTLFDRGLHSIVYEATDRKGQRAICSFTFKVEVISCPPIEWPGNGLVECPSGEFIYGTTCNVTCQTGFEMVPHTGDGKQRITCTANGKTDTLPNSCQEIVCPWNSTKLQAEHGTALCTDANKYNSLCTTDCKNGYTRETENVTVCGEDKTWSSFIPNCIDSQPPILKLCPANIFVFARKSTLSDPIFWTTPISEDNSGTSFINQTTGPTNGSRFPVGITEVRYVAVDLEGNVSPECVFFVNVEEIICEPPLLLDSYMTIECPDGYKYGSSCYLGCKSVFPLIGPNNITCEKNDTISPPKGYWNTGESDPYCQKNPCDPLPAPVNGAVVCDTWLFGRQCQMQCSGNYDIPLGVTGSNGASFTGAYTCSDLRGTYMPSNLVQNCTEKRNPRFTVLPVEFYYNTGDCNDATVLMEIKNNFIKHMQHQEKFGFQGVCPSQIECNTNNTVVTCGPVTGRRKKRSTADKDLNDMQTGPWLQRNKTKRNVYEIRVVSMLTTTWYNFNSSNGETLNFLESLQHKMFDVIKELGSSGNLTVRGLSPDNGTFLFGYSDPFCDDGLAVRWTTLTCVPCSFGTFLDNSNIFQPKCYDCPIGTYKDTELAPSCTQCPVGTSTLYQASTSENECIAKCTPGEYSATGLVPCTPCPRSTYQSQSMARACQPCPPGKTSSPGSSSVSECKDFDVYFKTPGDRLSMLTNVTSPETSLTVSLWIKTTSTENNITIYRAGTPSCTIEVVYKNRFYIFVNGNETSSNVILKTGKWNHVAIIVDSVNQTARIYMEGNERFTTPIPLPSGTYLMDALSSVTVENYQKDTNVSCFPCYGVGVVVSGYRVLRGVALESTVAHLASSCAAGLPTIADLTVESLFGASFIVPSMCIDTDHCSPNPCNGHRCVQEKDKSVCLCEHGFSGERCQNVPNLCSASTCTNSGTCLSTGFNFTCVCPAGYRGQRCETKIVNGGWSEWSAFSPCSVTCNGGNKTRMRECKSPAPDPDGLPCDMKFSSETLPCNDDPCPSCPAFPKSFGTTSNCTTNQTNGNNHCTLSCRPGLLFSVRNLPLEEYICGQSTGYEWNGIPPACGRGYGPIVMKIKSTVRYGSPVPCSQASTVAQALKNNMQNGLQCKINNVCSVQVEIRDCESVGRKRRSTSSEIIITLVVTFVSTDIDLTSYELHENMSQPLADLVSAIDELEASANQLNSTFSLFTFTVDGSTFTSSDVAMSESVQCSSTLGPSHLLCVECPSGTYLTQGICDVCPVGTYQDENGKSYCKTCPNGYTTRFVASQSAAACTVASKANQQNDNNSGSKEESNILLIISASGTLIVTFIMVSIIACCIYRYMKRSHTKINAVEHGVNMNRSGNGQLRPPFPSGPPPPYRAWEGKK